MAYVTETDFGKKESTKKKYLEIKNNLPRVLDANIRIYLLKLYLYAIQEVPVLTGALRATIRIETVENTVSPTEAVGQASFSNEYMLVAGDSGIINPMHMKEVNYAAIVNMQNPFIDRAIMLAEGDADMALDNTMQWVLKTWADDDPGSGLQFSLPVAMPEDAISTSELMGMLSPEVI